MGFSEEIKNIPEEELNQRRSKYGAPQDSEKRLIEIELERRKKNADEGKFNKALNVAENNVKSSKNLVKATWWLVIVTALLVLATLIPLILKVLRRWIQGNPKLL